MKIELDNGVVVIPPPPITKRIKALLFEEEIIEEKAGKKIKRAYKKKTEIETESDENSQQPEMAEGETKTIRDLTEQERANILELSKRGEMPAKIAKMFKLKPTAVSNFIYMEKIKS